MTESEKYKLAQKRVKQKKNFYRHLSVYLVMSTFFFLVNYLSSPGVWWFYWPMLGWGIGVAIQYVNVFGLTGAGLGTPEWEERQMNKEMDRLGISPPSYKETDDSLDLDEHLQLKQMSKSPADNYDNEDFV